MRSGAKILTGMLMLTATTLGLVPGARADEPPDMGLESTPPRLSLTDGQVSFWRPGAPDWTQAQVNTPLAPGDALSTGSPGTLEIQIGARAFVRAWGNTQIALGAQEPDFIQFTLPAGSATFDLRALDPGDTVEIDTPNAAVMIQQPGYYRVDVTGDRSRIMTREGGRATVTPAGGQAVTVTPSEELVVEGTASVQLAAYAAPPLDDWDRWNYARTDRLLDAVSARYVSPGTYGLSDLDPYGTWRVVPTYGAVWVPTGVPVGWTPYSTGSWVSDPVYGWTWVDTAAWGWAPYHHGRWCYVDGYWAWAPGPIIARPVYAPALVAFLGEPGAIAVGPAGPPVTWVALGWGEPVVPWWGRRGRGHGPSWRGWGGPRVVNNVVVSNTTVVNVQNITVYRNASVPHGVVAVDRARFGHGPITGRRIAQVDGQRLRPLPDAPQISGTPASLVPSTTRGIRPPAGALRRLEVAPERVRRGREAPSPVPTAGAPHGAPLSRPDLTVAKPSAPDTGTPLPRPSFGRGTAERPMADRRTPPAPPPRVHPAPVPSPVPPVTHGPNGGPPQVGESVKPETAKGGVIRRPSEGSATPARQIEIPSAPAKGPVPPPSIRPLPGPPATPARQVEIPSTPAKGPVSPPSIRPLPGPPATPARQVEIPSTPAKGPVSPPSIRPLPGPPTTPARQVEIPSMPGRGSVPASSVRQGPGSSGPPPRVEGPSRPKGPGPGAPLATGLSGGRPVPSAPRPEAARQTGRPLPGEPANHLAPGRAQRGPIPPGQAKPS